MRRRLAGRLQLSRLEAFVGAGREHNIERELQPLHGCKRREESESSGEESEPHSATPVRHTATQQTVIPAHQSAQCALHCSCTALLSECTCRQCMRWSAVRQCSPLTHSSAAAGRSRGRHYEGRCETTGRDTGRTRTSQPQAEGNETKRKVVERKRSRGRKSLRLKKKKQHSERRNRGNERKQAETELN